MVASIQKHQKQYSVNCASKHALKNNQPNINRPELTLCRDNLTREQYIGAEKRASLEICVIRDSLDSMDGVCRWAPHVENPVVCMTKLKGNAARMLQMFRTHSTD